MTRTNWTRLRKRIHWLAEKGASSVEYGILASLIAAVIITAVVFLGNRTGDNFTCTSNSVASRTTQC